MDEMLDQELQGVMGDMILSDVPKQMPVMEVKSQRNTNAEVEAAASDEKQVKRFVEDCNDCPFVKKRSLFDRLWDMTKWLGICGGICMLMWWFEMNGLMATEAARPFTFACGGIGFFGAGWSGRR